MFHFRPTIARPSALFELPRPVTSLRVQDAFDFAKWKVPLMTGDLVGGHTASGVDIAIEGQIALQAGALKLSEQQMFQTIEAFRAAVQSTTPDDRYRFFLYFDPATATYRSFRDCVTSRFEYDLSQKHLFTYSLVVHSCQPVMDTTAP